jgi:hypothetical protein
VRAVPRRGLVLLAIVALQAALLPLAVAGADEHLEVDTIVDGLRNPRHMAIADGRLFVAEAGVGGDQCFEPDPEDPDFVMCYGTSSRVSAIDLDTDDHEVVLANLPSLAGDEGPDEPFGWFAVGAHDVALSAPDAGVVIMGLGAPPEARDLVIDEVGAGASNLATLLRADFAAGTFAVAADLADYEQQHNPDGGDPEEHGIDTNPYAVLLDGGAAIAVDAGGNSLLRVPLQAGQTPTDAIETVAVFPPNPQPFPPFIPAPRGLLLPGDPVPTSVAHDTDNDAYLVGELPGFPFQPGAARVWSVDDDGVEVEPDFHADGFATIIDLTLGPDGHLYVLEISNEGLLAAEMTGSFRGALVRYDAEDGRREVLLADPLFAPGGLVFDDDGTLYISNCGVCGDDEADGPTGEILRVTGVADAEPIAYTAPTAAATEENQPVEIDVLADASDSLAIREVVDRGAGAVLADGAITYQPSAHFSGEDRIKYQACSEDACVIGEAVISVAELPTGRYDGANRIETAIRISRGHFPAGADAVVIARSDEYPDALAGGVLAAAAEAPVLLTRGDQLHPAVIAELGRLQPSTAYILGGSAAISEAVAGAVESETPVQETVRVSGENRFATAVAIRAELAELTGEAASAVYVAEGQHPDELRGWPDALAVSYLAGHEAKPILLVRHGEVPPATAAALEDGVAAATVVGGEAAVSAAVFAAIDGVVDDVDRVSGANRYETSTAIAELAIAAGLDPNVLYLATGRNWPDALAAGPSVALDGSVLLLVDPVDLDRSAAVRAYLAEHEPFDDIDLLGGRAAISDAVEQAIRAEVAGD